jgi:hypothetical protein
VEDAKGYRKFSPGPFSQAQNCSRSLVCEREGLEEKDRRRQDLQCVWIVGVEGKVKDAADGGIRGGIISVN